ncbi:hypothetical protein ACNTMW_31020 [Planosporangium sp. 12N6]|uniref:hypothetical protein n=1 Tax=Planosporangium spinosum TaxID=3402278 RepID=UPI003CF8DE84
MTTTIDTIDEQARADVPAEAATPAAPAEIDCAGLGAQLAPWAAMGALVLAAGAARLAAHATGDDAEVAGWVAGTAFVVAVVTAWATRRRMTSRKLRHRFLAALYLGATWLTAVTYIGLSLGAVATLGILGAGLSLLWWREHRIGPGIEPALLTEPGDDDLYVTRWATHLGGKGRQLAGSRLAEPQIIRAGYRYVLHLVPGVHTVEQVRAMPAVLRSGLGLLPGQDIIVEVHPDRPAPTAILTIVTRPPVRKPQLWPGPAAGFDAASGSVNLGPFADGEGVAQWSVYRADGIFGGYLQGGTGSGKSRMIEQIAMSCAASVTHPTVIWYGDGQNGSSSPLLTEHADYAATSFEAIYNMFQAALRVMRINGVENRLYKHVGFHPTPERPGLLVFLDECHKPLSPQENPLLAAATQLAACTIAREGRKVGVGLVMASQSPTLDAFGGAGNLADTLRQSLLAGNGVILRSKTLNAKTVFGVDINPREFPKLPGYAYLCDPEEGARSAPFRGYWVTDDLAATWPQRITWRSLPIRQTNAAGKAYARRHELAAEQAMNDTLLLQLADAGSLDEMFDDLQAMQKAEAAPNVDVIEFAGDAHPPVRRVERFWVPEPRTPAGLLPGQQKVLDAIRAGHTRPKQIQDTTGYSESQVHNLLGDLVRLGHIHKAGYGQYQPTAA